MGAESAVSYFPVSVSVTEVCLYWIVCGRDDLDCLYSYVLLSFMNMDYYY